MDSMMELVNALNALTAVLQKFTQQTTENYLNTFEELPTGDTDDASSTILSSMVSSSPSSFVAGQSRESVSPARRYLQVQQSMSQ